MNIRDQFPFIDHKKLRALVYKTPRHSTIKLGAVTFDRRTYETKQHLVLDAIARDKQALARVGFLRKQLNRERAEYYPHFNRTLTKREIQKLRAAKTAKNTSEVHKQTEESEPV